MAARSRRRDAGADGEPETATCSVDGDRDHRRQRRPPGHVQPDRRRAVAARPRRGRRARPTPTSTGMAASAVPRDPTATRRRLERRSQADLRRALGGRAGDRGAPRRTGAHVPPSPPAAGRRSRRPPSVVFDDEASSNATVIEVRATDDDRHPAPHHQGARRGRPRHPPRHGADDRHGRGRHVLRAHVDRRASDRPDHRAEIERAVLHAVTVWSALRVGTAMRRRSVHAVTASACDLRWSEALAAIARTGLGFTAEPVRARALRGGAARRRRHQGGRRRRPRRCEVATRDATTSCRSGWSRSARACPATSRRRWRSARSSATTPARSCSCSGPTRGIWLYPTGWADVGYSPAEVAVKEVAEETGIECEPVRLLAVIDGQRMGFTRFAMYMLLFHCTRDRRRAAAHPLETADVGWFGRRRPARAGGRGALVGADGVRRDRRRGCCPTDVRRGPLADVARARRADDYCGCRPVAQEVVSTSVHSVRRCSSRASSSSALGASDLVVVIVVLVVVESATRRPTPRGAET